MFYCLKIGLAALLASMIFSFPVSAGQDYWPTEEWRIASPESQGMDSDMLEAMLREVHNRKYHISSITVVRNGYLVLDSNIYPFFDRLAHPIYDNTSSILSGLIGIAIDKGYIKDIDQPVVSFFPNSVIANLDKQKKSMTLRHLLMRSSGLDPQDTELGWWDRLRKWILPHKEEDLMPDVLDTPVIREPGSYVEANQAAPRVLEAILQKKTGKEPIELVDEHIFNPLGINHVKSISNRYGFTNRWVNMALRPKDRAKLGLLFLNHGRWEDQQLIPKDWVHSSLSKQISSDYYDGYGFLWGVSDKNYAISIGDGGQIIAVVPDKQMVVVFTGPTNFYGGDTTAISKRLLENLLCPQPFQMSLFQIIRIKSDVWQN